ncbi:MAG: hypothetical protein RLZZ401_1432, partial [Pseudomonadota bacterium]
DKPANGTWSDWQLAFDDGQPGSLSEDNGAFVLSTPLALKTAAPEARSLQVGATTAIDGVSYQVSANARAALMAAQGELPHLPPLGQEFDGVELRSAAGTVLSLDYGTQPTQASLGEAVLLDDLKLVGLRAQSTQESQGQQFNCPQCGAPVQVKLATSKSVTCASCHSIISLDAGIGNQLQHATQDEPVQPLIPLGSAGQLLGIHWQLVGFQHRMGQPPDDGEHFGWSEYLLYNGKRGFCFLVDSEEGWSVVKPTTGAPTMMSNRQSASYQGKRFAFKYRYQAETVYVAGEFYWPVVRGQKTSNTDFANAKDLLSLEQTPTELTWSIGSQIDSALVAKAFGLEAKLAAVQRADVAPAASMTRMGCLSVIVLCLVLFVLLLLLSQCSSCDPASQDCGSNYSGGSGRSSGGSFGGFSGGGGHK